MKTSQQEIVNGIIDYCDRNGLDIDIYNGCNEPGYDDRPVLAANWNPPEMERIANLIENKLDDYALEWSDEWTDCQECGKAVRTSPDSYGWTPHYMWFNDCEILCLDCAKEYPDDIIAEYVNDYNRAIMPELYDVIEAAGFICYSPDEYCAKFETGFHPGQNDNPKDVAEDIMENLPDHEFIFKIDSVGQFDVQWSVFIRKAD